MRLSHSTSYVCTISVCVFMRVLAGHGRFRRKLLVSFFAGCPQHISGNTCPYNSRPAWNFRDLHRPWAPDHRPRVNAKGEFQPLARRHPGHHLVGVATYSFVRICTHAPDSARIAVWYFFV